MLVRGDSLARSMSDYLVREIKVTPNIRVRLHTEVIDGRGSAYLDTLSLHDGLHDQTEQIPAAALFVLIGGEPRTQWLPEAVELKAGYILTGRDLVRVGKGRQVQHQQPPAPGFWPSAPVRQVRVADDGRHRGDQRSKMPGCRVRGQARVRG